MANGGIPGGVANGPPSPDGNIERRVTAIEAVLPTLATKADLAELRNEMRIQNERVQSHIGSLRLHTENEKLRLELYGDVRERISHLEMEMRRLFRSLIKRIVLNAVCLFIAVGAYCIILGYLILERLPPLPAAQATIQQPPASTRAERAP